MPYRCGLRIVQRGGASLNVVDDETIGLFYAPSHVSETNDYHGIGFLRIPLSEVISSCFKCDGK